MTDLTPHDGDSPVRVNWSRWISDCEAPLCLNAWQVQPGDREWVCNLCGHTTVLRWPPDPAAIEYILGLRPDPHTRNWDERETVADLLTENVAHGITPPGVDALIGNPGPGGADDLLTVIDGVVVSGLLHEQIELSRQALAARVATRALEG